jgi:hypothetical protein
MAIGAGLVLGHRYIMRQLREGIRERLEKPLYRDMWEASQRSSPRWMRGEGFLLWFWFLTVLAAGVVIFYCGLKLVIDAV